jgi:cysteine desulfurase
MKTIYLDNAAATPQDPQVTKEIARVTKIYGNSSSFNDAGRVARKELNEARLKIARFLGAHADEIVFTSSGSEANNLAIKGIIKNFKIHIITTKIEHPSVLEPIKRLEKEGCDVTYLSVDKEGFINSEDLKKALRPETILVSIMYANNEIGTIQPIRAISKIIKNFKIHGANPLLHVDACQATEYLNMNVNNLGVDLLTFNGSKIYGPRGIGVLYIKRGVGISPLILGGSQEYGLRAGTENLPAIVGLAKAISIIDKKGKERLTELRDYLIEKIKTELPDIKINGTLGKDRLPNNINISIPDLDSENLLLELDKYGIYAGSGSACTAHFVEPSHVLKAIDVGRRHINGALRFSLGRQTTTKDINFVSKILPKIVSDLRKRYFRA